MKVNLRSRPSYNYVKPKPLHPENDIISLFIRKNQLKYYQQVEQNKKGNLIQTGRTMFSIIEIDEYKDSDCENDLTIYIEYDPNFLSHMWRIFISIGYNIGYEICLQMSK